MAQTRRDLLCGSGKMLAASTVLAAGSCTPTLAPAATASLDAELIQAGAEHIINVDAYNRDGGYLEPEDCPLWAAYLRTRNVISNARPQTLEGMLAKARAAKVESLNRGEEQPENGPAAEWAWDLVGDLLRMSGRT